MPLTICFSFAFFLCLLAKLIRNLWYIPASKRKKKHSKKSDELALRKAIKLSPFYFHEALFMQFQSVKLSVSFMMSNQASSACCFTLKTFWLQLLSSPESMKLSIFQSALLLFLINLYAMLNNFSLFRTISNLNLRMKIQPIHEFT